MIETMLADIHIHEKSFGAKLLMTDVKFSVSPHEKVGLVGRNGIGKSTLFGILTGHDTDFSGEVIFRRGTIVASTAQEHHGVAKDMTLLEYILQGLPEYAELHHIIRTYPDHMGDNMRKITEYTTALERFAQKDFYQVEERVMEELKNFQLDAQAELPFSQLSGGQKRLAEVVKIMHSDADIALLDEPTNHMDYVAKQQFIAWMKQATEAMIVITHDRDVLKEVDRIVELKDGGSQQFHGNYDVYLKQNAHTTGTAMTEFELIERRKANLRDKVTQFRRLKEKARDPDTIKQFKRREQEAVRELEKLDEIEKPTFWIDKNSVEQLDFKVANRYEKFKTRNIRIKLTGSESRSKHILINAKNLSLGYETPLFSAVNIDLREGEAVELRGRNGAGKTTLIKKILGDESITLFNGELVVDAHVRVGVYEQEVSERYFALPLAEAVERLYLDDRLPISDTKIRGLLSDYLFTEADMATPLSQLSGGQKARFQIIQMLRHEPQLLILDEPTNHLDLPSIEELETALEKYSGAILYVSHDGYFRQALQADVVLIGN